MQHAMLKTTGQRQTGLPRPPPMGTTWPTMVGNFSTPSAAPALPSTTGGDLSPRGKHTYPAWQPWLCSHIVAWIALIMSFVALVWLAVLYYPGHPHGNPDWDRKRSSDTVAGAIAIDGGLAEVAVGTASWSEYVENYVAFQLHVSGDITRWPPAPSVISELDITQLARTDLCCRVGRAEYFVCASGGKDLASNLGLSYVLRKDPNESGSHLLITTASDDMNGAECTFTWEAPRFFHTPSTAQQKRETKTPPTARKPHQHGRHAK